MSLKMVVTDLDGTLLTSADTLTPATAAAFTDLAAQNIISVIATGRMYQEAQFAAEHIGATRYFIGMNGAQTVDLHTQRVIYEKTLDEVTVGALVEILDALGLFYQIYSHRAVYARARWVNDMGASGMKAEYIRRFAALIRPFTDAEDLCAVKFFVICKDDDIKAELQRRITALNTVTMVSSYPGYFEILPRGLNKGDALLRLCAHLDISPQSVAAIGDSDNDVEMLMQAGVAIAMGNAYPRIKDIADHIVPRNDEDGVAFALTHIIPKYL
ncbi:HAD family phosphatase [Enterobacteriaceae bacterium 4M9]|nr:HAD family phosphatase [Enterobacteriaceae bacterium 4M9]